MTAKEFTEKMEKLSNKRDNCYDCEDRHIEMDDLMCEVLTSLGYGEGVKIFKQTTKWYS